MTPERKAAAIIGQMKSQMRGPGIEANEGNAVRCAIEAVKLIQTEYANNYTEDEIYWQQVLEILKAK